MGGKPLDMLIILYRSTCTCKQTDTLFAEGCFVLEEWDRMKLGEQAWNAAALRGQREESTKSRTLPGMELRRRCYNKHVGVQEGWSCVLCYAWKEEVAPRHVSSFFPRLLPKVTPAHGQGEEGSGFSTHHCWCAGNNSWWVRRSVWGWRLKSHRNKCSPSSSGNVSGTCTPHQEGAGEQLECHW